MNMSVQDVMEYFVETSLLETESYNQNVMYVMKKRIAEPTTKTNKLNYMKKQKIRDKGIKRINIELDTELYESLRMEAFHSRKYMSHVIREALKKRKVKVFHSDM